MGPNLGPMLGPLPMTDRAVPIPKTAGATGCDHQRVTAPAPVSSFRKYGLAVLMLVLAPAVHAEPWACTFTAECVAGGACADAAFQIQVIAADHEGRLFFRTTTGAAPAIRLTEAGTLPATYAGARRGGIGQMLTVEEDATALFTLHIFDATAQAATYFGTCEDLG